MNYLSVCSGIEAATVAWHPLGWNPVAFSEIEKFPSRVLAHHYPDVPNVGDMTKFEEWNIGAIDLFVGGTPCQSFSVAGLRKGLDDPRGNLMLTFGAIANRFRPRWLVWENVPGVLSSNGGRDFGAFVGMLGELGYGWAYRVLDAQYFGVAQRRRRVFVVGCLGNWRHAAAVLFERHSLSGNPAPSREKKQRSAGRIKNSSTKCSSYSMIHVIPIPTAIPISTQNALGRVNGIDEWPLGIFNDGDPAPTISKSHGHAVATNITNEFVVRRLTPVECERLQGFPDNYTNIPNAADGPRYKALGNSMAVPVMHWIGKRIQFIQENI